MDDADFLREESPHVCWGPDRGFFMFVPTFWRFYGQADLQYIVISVLFQSTIVVYIYIDI